MKIMIVEDLSKNIKVAKEALEKICELDIATSYERAMELLEENIYSAAILDLNFPRHGGGEPEKLGFELEAECIKRKLPCVILSATTHGGGGSGRPVSRIYKKKEDIYLTQSAFNTIDLPEKRYPESWKMALKFLQMIAPNMEQIARAKERLRRYKTT